MARFCGYVAFALPLFMSSASSQYTLKDRFSGASFMDNFNFWTSSDPTNGFVTYVDQATAIQNGLLNKPSGAGANYWGVDYTTTISSSGAGRQSIRLTSKNSYTEGLFILDALHMPGNGPNAGGGICGVWPSFWSVGPDWPNNGEIDIVEGVNSASTNLMSLHTKQGCATNGHGESGTVVNGDCWQYDPNQSNSGCGVSDADTTGYGSGFNNGNGGVYAMEWSGTAIKVWYFARSKIPSDISSGKPNPSGWGTPRSNFDGAGGCNIPNFFANHQLVFDTTFCGDWAGAVFGSDPNCKNLASSCTNYVAANPSAFKNAYWAVNSVSVYTASGSAGAASSVAESSSTESMTPLASIMAMPLIKNVGQGRPGPLLSDDTASPATPPIFVHQLPAWENATDANTGKLAHAFLA